MNEIDNHILRLKKWLDNGVTNIGLLYSTGTGKTRVALELWKHIGAKSVCIFIAERAHRNNWLDEFKKWQFNLDDYNVAIECYASMKKHVGKKYDLVIFDESHHLGSDMRKEYLKYIDFNYAFLLSATMPIKLRCELDNIIGYVNYDKITMNNAISMGRLAEPKVKILTFGLEDLGGSTELIFNKGKGRKIYIPWMKRGDYLFNRFKYKGFEVHIPCTWESRNEFHENEVQMWKQKYFDSGIEKYKQMMLRAGMQRKLFLGEAKTAMAAKVIRKLKDRGDRFIVFCSSIEQANRLGGEHAIHSNMAHPEKVIEQFNNEEISNIYAVGMLQEGMNLTGIESGLLIQLDNYERGWIQKMGRVMRADNPKIYILHIRGTQDDKFLENVLEGIDNKYIER